MDARAMKSGGGAGRVWLITGASAGFGRELALAALARGDAVAATARDRARLADLVEAGAGRVHAVELDLAEPDAPERAAAEALDRFGRVDVLVNNAGHGSVGAVEELTLDELRTIFEPMFFGAVALTKSLLPSMRERRSGAIVQISSMGGQVVYPGFGAYCAAKFALEGISTALAGELEPFGIRVLIVEPGAFRTEFGGSRMHRSRELDEYAVSVAATRRAVDEMDGSQPGDPAKAAVAIIGALDAPDPPLRLALGRDAVEAIRAEHRRRAGDLAAWEEVSVATDLDPEPAAA